MDLQSPYSRRSVLTSSGAAVTLALAGCIGEFSGNSSDDDEQISAVNGSFFMLYDLARQVAGDQLEVEDLVPVGAHGDDWEPSPGIIEDVAEADVFVYLDGFRGWSDNVAESLPGDYPHVVVINAGEGIDFIEGETGRDLDPHFWLDPLLTKEAVDNIRDGYVEADPEHESVYDENAAALKDRLDDVHEQYQTAMEHRKQEVIVIGSHDSFQYWTELYDVAIHSPVGISPDGEPTAREMQEISDVVEENDLKYILYDMYEATNYADSIADETGTETLPLSPVEATTEEQLEDGMGYVEHMLDINLNTLEQALEVDYPE